MSLEQSILGLTEVLTKILVRLETMPAAPVATEAPKTTRTRKAADTVAETAQTTSADTSVQEPAQEQVQETLTETVQQEPEPPAPTYTEAEIQALILKLVQTADSQDPAKAIIGTLTNGGNLKALLAAPHLFGKAVEMIQDKMTELTTDPTGGL